MPQVQPRPSGQGFLLPHLLVSPGGSESKDSAHHAGDLGSILAYEDPLEKEMATYSNILTAEFHGQRSLAAATVHIYCL